MFPSALFLDRDGTLIEDRHYLSDPSGVALIDGVKETLHGFAARGCRLFLFTNQSGVGRGLFSLQDVERCNQRMFELLDLPKPGFVEICVATEGPDVPAIYRKPSPRFILEMASKYGLSPGETWMVGDRLNDVKAGLNAGVQTALISEGIPEGLPSGVWRCRDLREFHARLLKAEQR
jgi:D-glycero-D-manno-heptose 1,7-bisphosphate phosphatase